MLNTYRYDECRDYIREMDDDLHFKVISKILDIFDSIRQENYTDIDIFVSEIINILQQIEDNEFDKKFKELINQILEDFRTFNIGFPKKKIVINWHLLTY